MNLRKTVFVLSTVMLLTACGSSPEKQKAKAEAEKTKEETVRKPIEQNDLEKEIEISFRTLNNSFNIPGTWVIRDEPSYIALGGEKGKVNFTKEVVIAAGKLGDDTSYYHFIQKILTRGNSAYIYTKEGHGENGGDRIHH